jgi:hypothetical protein
VNFLTLNITGKYYQIAYMLSARGTFYATGSNVRLPDGQIVRENKGDIIVWQTQPLEHSSPKSALRLSNARRDGS